MIGALADVVNRKTFLFDKEKQKHGNIVRQEVINAFMRKFGELEVTAKFERGQSFYDMEFTEFEDAGFTEDQEESFGTGADRANEKHKQQVHKNTQDTELVLKKPSRKELEEQYKRYLQSQDLNR